MLAVGSPTLTTIVLGRGMSFFHLSDFFPLFPGTTMWYRFFLIWPCLLPPHCWVVLFLFLGGARTPSPQSLMGLMVHPGTKVPGFKRSVVGFLPFTLYWSTTLPFLYSVRTGSWPPPGFSMYFFFCAWFMRPSFWSEAAGISFRCRRSLITQGPRSRYNSAQSVASIVPSS